jgi:uncharacterized protein
VTLCDTGPLVALIDRDDANHRRCLEVLATLPPNPLITTWPCLTEAMHLLDRAGGQAAQEELWGYLADDLLRLHLPAEDEWKRLKELMKQYSDMPLDLADASLVSAAERLNEIVLFSLDQPLRAAKLANGRVFDMKP